MNSFENRKVAVVGLDDSGVSACLFLRRQGARVTGLEMEIPRTLAPNKKRLKEAGIPVASAGELKAGGYEAIVHSMGVSRHNPVLQGFLEKGIPVLSDLELAAAKFCCLSVAIAGTNGKTTTADLVEKILTQSGRKTIKGGGSGEPVCDIAEGSRDLDFVTLEVNSFQLETIEHFRPAVAVLLNLKPDHMDQYDRVTTYVRTVANLFKNQQAFDWAIVQTEALAHLRSLDIEPPGKLITFSANNRRADISFDRGLLISQLDGWTGPLFNMEQSLLKGPHNAENVMAALAVGHVLRVPLEEMADAIREYKPGPHRLELVAEVNGVKYINNSKAMNVAAVDQSIEAIAPARGGEPNIWLIAGGKDKGLNYHDLGPLLATRVKGAFLLGETAEKLRAAWGLFTPCRAVGSLLEAVEKAAENAAAGDVVLLSPACSSFDMFQNYEHRGEVFRQAVQDLAKTGGSSPGKVTEAASNNLENLN
jgi:UDP-N-acetylmuramoylalanine--D-glutamate ligase